MKRGATKEQIIRMTQELIIRNGMRAVRVDEIAQTLGISKRTLYEMFADKNDLLNACLEHMNRQQQQRIVACRKRRSGNSLQKVIRLSNDYMEMLYTVERNFIDDVRHKVVFAERYTEQRKFWRNELALAFEECREEGFLLPEIVPATFAAQLLDTLLELRLRHTMHEEVYLFCRTILRGAVSQQGIGLIDGKC